MNEKSGGDRRRLIAEAALRALLEGHVCRFPLELSALRLPDVALISYQDYSAHTGVALRELTKDGFFPDGYTVRNLRGRDLIFYDGAAYTPRRTFTVCHELGHLLLGHAARGRCEEAEAHAFAAQMMAPDAAVRWLERHGAPVSGPLLESVFCLSAAAARRKALEYARLGPAETELDGRLCAQMRGYLLSIAPLAPRSVEIAAEEREPAGESGEHRAPACSARRG